MTKDRGLRLILGQSLMKRKVPQKHKRSKKKFDKVKGVKKHKKNIDIHLHSQSLLNKKSILPRSSIFRHSYWQSIGSSFGAIGARSTFRSYSFSHKEEKHNIIWDSGFVHKWPIFCSYCKRPKKWPKWPKKGSKSPWGYIRLRMASFGGVCFLH